MNGNPKLGPTAALGSADAGILALKVHVSAFFAPSNLFGKKKHP